MFDENLNRQVRLTYLARGPQWAFALPDGDIDALKEVMRACSTFWNGAGSLLVPVRKDGRIWPHVDECVAVTPIDRMWLHPGLASTARDAVLGRYPGAGEFRPGFDRVEHHPLDLLPERDPAEPRPTLARPDVRGRRLEAIALACWGWIPEDELPEWGRSLGILTVDGDDAIRSIIGAQVGPVETSPLRATLVGMDAYHHTNPHEFPYLVILGGSFRELVVFWNVRSRSAVWMSGSSIVGVPYEAIRRPALLSGLAHWAQPPLGVSRTPELMVTGAGDAQEIASALQHAGFDPQEEPEIRHSVGGDAEPRSRPLYGYYKLLLGGPLVRGTAGATLCAIADGRTSVSLPRLEPLLRGGNRALRIVVDGLPLSLPLTDSLGPKITDDGIATRDGVMRQILDWGKTWELDFRVPSRSEALPLWAADRGFTTSLTQDGRYAEALLARFADLDALDVLADEDCLTVLGALASQSRLKLVQRLKRELAPELPSATPEHVAEIIAKRLQTVGIFLELEAKDAATLGGDVGSKKRALRALAPLVETGLVMRGQSVRCPACNHPSFVTLEEMAERVRCPACRLTYVLPVLAGAGQEPPIQYRLDGLMARIMDQDTLPVLLALRAFRRLLGASGLFFAWPGIAFTLSGHPDSVDADLVVSTQGAVFCCEVKTTATSLDDGQLEGVLELAERLKARPALAALTGQFLKTHRAAVIERGGRILERVDLLQ